MMRFASARNASRVPSTGIVAPLATLWPPPSPPTAAAATRSATARSSPWPTSQFVPRPETL